MDGNFHICLYIRMDSAFFTLSHSFEHIKYMHTHTCYTQFLSYIYNANNDNDNNNNNNKIINMRGESYCVCWECVSFNVLARTHGRTHTCQCVYCKCNKETLRPFFSLTLTLCLSLQINFYIRFFSVDHIQFKAHSKSHTIFDVMNKTTHR